MASRHGLSIDVCVFAVALRVDSNVPAERTSLNAPGPSAEMPTLTL
jgi:hypothetical protein